MRSINKNGQGSSNSATSSTLVIVLSVATNFNLLFLGINTLTGEQKQYQCARPLRSNHCLDAKGQSGRRKGREVVDIFRLLDVDMTKG